MTVTVESHPLDSYHHRSTLVDRRENTSKSASTHRGSVHEQTGNMAEKKPETTAEFYDGLVADLNACDNVSELFKLANSEEFRNDISLLGDSEQAKLREVYVARNALLDNRVKLEEFDGQTVMLVDVESLGNTDYGETVKLHIKPENSEVVYKAISSSAAIVRFTQRLKPLPTPQAPYRIHLAKVPVSNPVDAAKGFRRWTVKMLPYNTNAPRTTGAPF